MCTDISLAYNRLLASVVFVSDVVMRSFLWAIPVLLFASVTDNAAWELEDDSELFYRDRYSINEKFPKPIIIYFALRKLSRWLIPTASKDIKNVSKECRKDSQYYAKALNNLEPWALTMYDATGKSQDGFARGNLHAMGHFDQCLDVSIDRFDGQYCNVHLLPIHAPNNNISDPKHGSREKRSVFDLIHIWATVGSSEPVEPVIYGDEHVTIWTKTYPSWAFCLPATCSAEDVAIAVAEAVGSFSLHGIQLAVQNGNSSCFTRNKNRSLDSGAIAMMSVFGVLGLLLLVGTALDTWLRLTIHSNTDEIEIRAGKPAYLRVLLCFSIFTNGRQILQAEDEGTPHTFRCLHGIKVLSLIWVIVGNTFSVYRFIPNSNVVFLEMSTQESALDQVIMNAYVSMDGFFFISGLLVTYITLRDLDSNKGRFNVFIYYVHRFLRFTPTYAFAIFFMATLAIYTDPGPNWAQIELEAISCKRYWWQHLLYINNFLKDDACFMMSWYFANEAQFFLVSPILIYAIWKSKRVGLILLTVVTVCCLIATMILVAVYDISVQIATRLDIENHNFSHVYNNKPWCRISPYLIGILVGWILHYTSKSPIQLPKLVIAIGWCANTALSMSILLGLYGYVRIFSEKPTEAANVVYLGLHSCGWAICLGFIVVACIHGYGGYVNRVLSWKGFVPLSKITFCTFLVNFEWIDVYYSRTRKPVYYTIGNTFSDGLGHVILSMTIGFVMTVCIEAPLVNVQRMFVAARKRAFH